MSRRVGIRVLIVALPILSVTAGPLANAAIEKFASINVFSSFIFGDCLFRITENELFSAINADCELVQKDEVDDIQLALVPISGFEFGYPRTETYEKNWPVSYSGTIESESIFCTNFGMRNNLPGSEAPIIELGHNSDPSENTSIFGSTTCAPSPPPVARAYFVTACTGPFEMITSVESLDPNEYSSYKFIEGPPICYVVSAAPPPI